MKHTLLVMGLALGLCPVWAAAQAAADGGLTAEGSTTENWTEGEEKPWATDPELSPNAAPGTGWTSVLPYDFRGSSMFSFITSGSPNLWCTAQTSAAYAYARLDIPDGRKIQHFRLWGFDNSSGDITAQLREVCLPRFAGADDPTNTTLAELDSVGASNAFSRNVQLNPAPVVDTYSCTYWAYALFSRCDDLSYLTLRKIFVEYTQ